MTDLILIIEGTVYFIEVKQRTGKGKYMLKHPFKGPQISIMRLIRKAGGLSYGVIGLPRDPEIKGDIACLIHPDDIPANGNFDFKQMHDFGCFVWKNNHIWRIDQWESTLCGYRKKSINPCQNQKSLSL